MLEVIVSTGGQAELLRRLEAKYGVGDHELAFDECCLRHGMQIRGGKAV
jgi:hypothetical protein